MNEFELIEKFFHRQNRSAIVGNGDDAAVIAPETGHAFVVTTDTMIEGRHFLPTLDPWKLGRRAVHINLSDLAAMGATPRFAMLSLTLRTINEAWLARMAEGFWHALDEFGVELVGGNTTKGELSLALTAFGEAPLVEGRPITLLRSGAKPGDELWVSGALGEAGWALGCMTGEIATDATRAQIDAYEMPTARISLGTALRTLATSCIDVSDGLLSEAQHLARASKVSIDIDFVKLPTSLMPHLANPNLREHATRCLLTTGDAYELLFTAPPSAHPQIARLLAEKGLAGACIGQVKAVEQAVQVSVHGANGQPIALNPASALGWDHFAA